MPNLKDLRLRIGSVRNTQQITRAMKMVSAAKLRRAQQNIVNLRPYAKKLLEVIADISVSKRVNHPLLNPVAIQKKVLMVVLTSDRGLCAGFNANINRFAFRFLQDNRSKYEKMDIMFIGRKGADFFKARKVEAKEAITNLAKDVSYHYASQMSARLLESFTDGGYDAIYMIYNEFKSAIAQNVVCEQLLPIDMSKTSFTSGAAGKSSFSQDLVFEPAPELMIDELLQRHFAVQIYRCMCESVAAEHGARMTAMENATKNASDMIRNLTLTYNKLRQASITTELIEITSGAEALKG
ncbi:MAG: ATP synthase F1 subunit gamma [Bdellovibrionales bacterium]